jgi:hypothetical protein
LFARESGIQGDGAAASCPTTSSPTTPWFDNHRRLRELIAELEALSLDIAEADPRWNR